MINHILWYILLLFTKSGLAVMNRNNFGTCQTCVEVEECQFVQKMNERQQKIWTEHFPCDKITSGTTKVYDGFSSIAKGDLICCPQKIHLKDNNNKRSISDHQTGKIEHTSSSESKVNNLETNPSGLNVRNNQRKSYGINNDDKNENNHRRIRQAEQETESNPYFIKQSLNSKRVPNPNNNDELLEQQCEVQTSLPPDPETGCCGHDMSDADRFTDLKSFQPTLAPLVSNKWKQYFLPREAGQTRKTEGFKSETDEVTFQSWIAGGNETELDQFPWTVLLSILFDHGDRPSVISCGGSLISSQYVLTAGHCVYEEGAQLASVTITLAEYDKRTFPNDCVAVNGEGRKCIQNIIITAENVIIHPLYEDAWLHNDIALIRLRGFAPYTRFIRPICLAPLDIDVPNLTNVPLSVSGWGRNKEYSTDVKQSTVLNLIPRDQCERYYPNLSKDHICAAGRAGEDTCKGDSGGPLMILFSGRYYLMGVVSGKRADSPCGTSVPSLFTNVFNYLDWIQSAIRNYESAKLN